VIPLLVPGPATVSDTVRQAQARQPIYHRGVEYGTVLAETARLLGVVLGTAGEVHCVTGSGTATMEMAVANTCRPGDSVVVASNGYFGERLADMCTRLGLNVTHVRAGWDEPLPLERVEAALNPDTVALVAVHHETSTGRVNDLPALASRCQRHGVLCVIDAISSAGVLPIEMDQHGIDVVVATSQKGMGGTPGVGVLTGSELAWRRVESLPPPATLAADWMRVRRSFRKNPPESQWTPAVCLMAGLHAALREFATDGQLVHRFAERAAIGRALRHGLRELGFGLWPSGAVPVGPVTVAEPPPGADADVLVDTIRRVTGVDIGAGQGPLAGRVIRLTHVGIGIFDVLGTLGAMHATTATTNGAAITPDWVSAVWDAYTRGRP
jgi:aspartate aminotransferase-like enzyme